MNILVLCTGNSASSILLEALLNQYGKGRVEAWSAGSHPVGVVYPEALAVLACNGIASTNLSSKSWELFSASGAPVMDAVVTVCGNAETEVCPMWSGSPLRAHWGVDDPAAAPEGDRPRAFAEAYDILASRARSLLEQPIESMDARSLGEVIVRTGATE